MEEQRWVDVQTRRLKEDEGGVIVISNGCGSELWSVQSGSLRDDALQRWCAWLGASFKEAKLGYQGGWCGCKFTDTTCHSPLRQRAGPIDSKKKRYVRTLQLDRQETI